MKVFLQQSNIRFSRNLCKGTRTIKSGSKMQKESGLQNMCDSGSLTLSRKRDRTPKKTNVGFTELQ